MFNENDEKSKFKFSIGIALLTILLALAAIFITYLYYRQSINPNPQKIIKTTEINEEKIKEAPKEITTIVTNYNEEGNMVLKVNAKSIFDTDLKITEELMNAESKSLSKNLINTELTEEFINESINEIMRLLYTNNNSDAYDLALEISENYNFEEFRKFEVFIYEILELKNYKTISIKEKTDFLSLTYSPEIILFLYLDLDLTSQINITKNKQSHILMTAAVQGLNLIYEANLTAGLYSEMDINNAYFVVPKDIEGYKIKFKLNDEDIVLYYIRYKETGKIDIIYLENLTNSVSTMKEYIEMK